MKNIILLIISILNINLILTAQDIRNDSLSINTYTLDLDLSNLGNKQVSGTTQILFLSKVNATNVTLDLASSLNVSEVKFAEEGVTTAPVGFTHSGSKLLIAANTTTGNKYVLEISYNGTPEKDPSGWGGFYFTGAYAFNLGVGFQVNPHNYGRAWFPCLDDFVSRAKYRFNVTTASTNKAFCNGLLDSETDNGNGTTTWKWVMNDPIPTYLASVAVAPYATIKSNYTGIENTIPIEIGALPTDTTKVKASFINLPGALAAFEATYGPHTFSRVGFNMVPFNGGAMEHATNIAYPLNAADGTTDRETLFAHELSHHWWGNTVTCRTAADMWINEGWASYSEKLFLESIYGTVRYKEAVSENHYEVLRWAHLRDGQARAIQGIPHEYTYGMHVYDKGADVVHTLRGYMGKADFTTAIKSFLSIYKFMDVSTEDLRDEFQKHTTADLTAFFDNWVFTPGFPHFELLEVKTSQNGNNYQNEIIIDQKQRFTSKVYTGVPLEVTFYNTDLTTYTETVIIDGYYQKHTINTPFKPVYAALDFEEKISDAITDMHYTINAIGAYSFDRALMNITVTSAPAEALLRVEHHWVGPDASNNSVQGLYLSNSRYWTVDGILPDGFGANATVIYDGRTPSNKAFGFLDNNHIKITEDSLVLMYRSNKLSPWVIYDDYTKNTGSTGDAYGTIVINNIQKGDYCFAMYDQTLSNHTPVKKLEYLVASPNPTTGMMYFDISNMYQNSKIVIINSKGQIIDELPVYTNSNRVSLDTTTYPKGVYFANLVANNKSFERLKFIVK